MKTINEILKDYTAGAETLEETNAALKEVGAGYHLEPGRNQITEEDRRETTVGYFPEQANGWGLLDTGTGTLDKVHVVNGRLDHAVNEVLDLPDKPTNMAAYVTICGKVYEVLGDKLSEVLEHAGGKSAPLPDTADKRRRQDLAGQMMDQKTKTGVYRVTYDSQGYAIRAVKLGGENNA